MRELKKKTVIRMKAFLLCPVHKCSFLFFLFQQHRICFKLKVLRDIFLSGLQAYIQENLNIKYAVKIKEG